MGEQTISSTFEELHDLFQSTENQLDFLNTLQRNVSNIDSHEGMSEKLDHLMHSDTIILVIGLLVMILLGLIIRSLCLRLSRDNNRKKLMREGLKQIAAHMDFVTRSMSDDLELPNSPRTVLRTYSGRKSETESDCPYSKEKEASLREIYLSNRLRDGIVEEKKEVRDLSAELGNQRSLENLNLEDDNKTRFGDSNAFNIKRSDDDIDTSCSTSMSNFSRHSSFSSEKKMLVRNPSLQDIAFGNSLVYECEKKKEEERCKKDILVKRDSLREIAFCNSLNHKMQK